MPSFNPSDLGKTGFWSDQWDKFTGYKGQSEANRTNLQIARETNQQNYDIFQENLQFQERMSNTAYQRSMADMKKAGLNPILAHSQGGASSPGGSSAQMQPATMQNPDANQSTAIIGAINTALAVNRQVTEIEHIKSQTAKNKSDVSKDKPKAAVGEGINTGIEKLKNTSDRVNAKVMQKSLEVLNNSASGFKRAKKWIRQKLGLGEE